MVEHRLDVVAGLNAIEIKVDAVSTRAHQVVHAVGFYRAHSVHRVGLGDGWILRIAGARRHVLVAKSVQTFARISNNVGSRINRLLI